MAPIQANWTGRADRLNIMRFDHRMDAGNAAGLAAALHIQELQAKQEQVRIVFAAAPSQNEFLDTLINASGIDWSRVTAFHMDEYIGLPSDAPQRFARFLEERLFAQVRPGTIHYINSSSDPKAECSRYAELISEQPIDVVCLGIGENGHIAFNDPPVAQFNDPLLVKPVQLDEACRQQQVNDGCFAALEEVPTHALTLTIPALMSGRKLFCIVPGRTKRTAVLRTIFDPIDAACPATVLRHHPDCTLYVDMESCGTNKGSLGLYG